MGIIIALDVGDVRVGIAVSDESKLLARPLTIVKRANNEALSKIIDLLDEYQSKQLLVGLPLDKDGNETEQSEKIKAFVRRISRRTDALVTYYDESYTSVEAKEHYMKNNPKTSSHGKLDALAASFMLQEYLNTQNEKK